MFFDDRLAMPGIYGRSVAEAVRTGARPVKLDLSIVLGICAAATQSDRSRGDLLDDLLLAVPRRPHVRHARPPLGRQGGLERRDIGERQRGAELRGQGGTSRHDARYDRADEFLEATTGLWDSWDDDALVLDRETPLFADPDKVHELDYEGEWFSVRGPLTVPRSPARPARAAAGRIVGPGPRLRGALGRADLHRRPRHRHRPCPLQGPEGEDRRGRPRPRCRQDAAHGLHGRRRVEGPRRGARADVPQRPRRPHGLADPALRADELRLLGPVARRPHHRRAHRVGVGHPRARPEHQGPHRRGHRDAGRPGRPPRHPVAGPTFRRHRDATSPTRWRSGSTAAPATDS